VLDQLLGAAVQQPDMRIDPLDDLAVQFEHKAQDAMRRRMLRTEIDVEVADVMRRFIHGGSPSPSRRRAARSPCLPRREEVELAEFLVELGPAHRRRA
jgi:hypothetical protein